MVFFLARGWSNTAAGCTERCWCLCPCRHLRLTWTQTWAAWSKQTYLDQRDGLDNSRGCFQSKLLSDSVLLPALSDAYTHANKRGLSLCWEVILLIATFTAGLLWFSIGTSMNCCWFLSNEVAEQRLRDYLTVMWLQQQCLGCKFVNCMHTQVILICFFCYSIINYYQIMNLKAEGSFVSFIFPFFTWATFVYHVYFITLQTPLK